MAHLVDGVLSMPVLAAGAVVAAAAVGYGLRRIGAERLPYVGLMSAAFFVASLVHIPVGPSNVHLILNGLLGVVLGWAAVPAIFTGLLLQAMFFGYGGITVLGVNTLIMGLPAVACWYLFARPMRDGEPFVWGAAAGAGAIVMTCGGVALALALSGREFLPAAQLVCVAHLPVVAVEAMLTGTIAAFLRQVKPEVLSLSLPMLRRAPADA
ncbi:MAG: cobalt transporter CbiM [Rhodospirillales bacterium]|nr:cobalt transporter CbiM [Rhodospirillales bacterium]